ncbi:MAG: phospholipid carrier-dependent glycosyltransferase [Spirochaetales bacterium]|nr:phospholipid carrier-dependent glycosyltransferase [Spirochaetales bacterium]
MMNGFKTGLLMLCILIGLQTGLGADGNLVVNGDFEEVAFNLPSYWDKNAWKMEDEYTNFYVTPENPKSGKYAAVIENLKSNDARLIQKVIVKPETVYTLSCFAKAVNLPADRVGAGISVIEYERGFWDNGTTIHDTMGDWEYLSYTVKTAPNQTILNVAIRLGGYAGDTVGKAFFDDFRLVEERNISGLYIHDIGAIQQPKQASKAVSSPVLVVLIIAAAIILCLIGVFLIYLCIFKPKQKKEKDIASDFSDKTDDSEISIETALRSEEKARMTYKDIILAGSLTVIYAIIAFTNLGYCKAPQTYWQPSTRGEFVVVDFGRTRTVNRIYYMSGLPGQHEPDKNRYEVEYSHDNRTWTHAATIDPKTIYWWYYKETSFNARYVKITVDVPGSWLMEVVFVGPESRDPIHIDKIIPGYQSLFSKGDVKNLFDEQNTYTYRPSIMSGMSPGFDEQYHARTAMEHIVFRVPYEDTHPPLGKLLMALGILIFGMTPFGWRFMGTFFGVLMVPLMYAFGKQLFKKTEFAFIASFLMAFDFMHFSQTRIATIDSYGVFFILLTFYFIYRYYKMSFFSFPFKKTLVPLLLAGIAWGLGIASKWIALYIGPGIFIILAASLFKRITENRRMKTRLKSKSLKKDRDEWNRIRLITSRFGGHVIATLCFCILVFLILSPLIYALAYTPILFSKDIPGPQWIIDNSIDMYNYHNAIKDSHSYSSKWWQWPFITKPMAFYFGTNLPPEKDQRLFSFGNPAVWWIGSISALVLLGMMISGIVRRTRTTGKKAPKNIKTGTLLYEFANNREYGDDERFIILIALASNYLPWIIVPRRLTFIYHFFASVPFIIFSTVYLISLAKKRLIPYMRETLGERAKAFIIANYAVIYGYLVIVLFLFIMFYPIIAGTITDRAYIRDWLDWDLFPQWYFQ